MGPLMITAMAAQAYGQLMEGYNAYNAARTKQVQMRSEADMLEYQSSILGIMRRDAERAARDATIAGQDQIAAVTLAGRQRRGAIRAAAAGRGVAGESVREAEISDQLVQDMDVYQINIGAVRAANAAKAEATRFDTEALFARVGARNRRRIARAASPETYLLAGLVNAGGSAAGTAGYRSA